MSVMLLLVDGYNVTRSDPATCDLPLFEQREALVARLRVRGRDLLGKGRIVVVFDGKEGPALSTGGAVPVEIVYAHARSADDEIVRIASAAAEKVVVVTTDRALAGRVSALLGERFEARDGNCCFEAARGKARSTARGRGAVARDAGLPRGAAAITRELKDLWLSGDDD
jgi:predicted RNA-binding protein with PIN domain